MIADGKVFRWKWRHGVVGICFGLNTDHNNKTHKLQYKVLVVNSLIWLDKIRSEQKLWEKAQVVIELGPMLNNT